mgnify:CR=1 FL=1
MPTKKNSNPKPSSKAKVSKKVSKKSEPVVDTPVEEVVETPVVDTPVVTPVETPVVDQPLDKTVCSYDEDFKVIGEQLKAALFLVKDLTTKFNSLEKRVLRDRKVMDKKMRGRAKRVVDPNKPPSGFAKPGPVSNELRKFLGIGKDELIARTVVTSKINEYAKLHKLQQEDDKRKINPDATLKKLLKLGPEDALTFFNLQKYMKVHYPNKEGVIPAN